VAEVAISHNICFTGMCFGSCIRTSLQADKVVKKSYHVEHLMSFYTVYVCTGDLSGASCSFGVFFFLRHALG